MAEKEYIEREAAKNILKRHEHRFTCADESNGYGSVKWSEYVIYSETAQNCMDAIPAADVRPVVRGKWIDRDDKYYGWNMWACSACGEEFILAEGTPDMNEYHFCPNCGADMREES